MHRQLSERAHDVRVLVSQDRGSLLDLPVFSFILDSNARGKGIFLLQITEKEREKGIFLLKITEKEGGKAFLYCKSQKKRAKPDQTAAACQFN